MKSLCQVTELYRVDTEAEVEEMLKAAKADGKYVLVGYKCDKKETKEDEYFKVSLIKSFNDIKDPTYDVTVTYEVDE